MQQPNMQQQMPGADMEEMDDELEPGTEPATPEEQAQLEQAVQLAEELLFGEGQAGDQIANIVQQSQDITEGIGKATAAAIIAIEKRMGGVIDDAVKWELGREIIAMLAGIAVEYGALAEDEIGDDFLDAVVSHAYSEYLTLKEQLGELDPQQLQATVSEAEQMMGGQQQQQAAPKGRGLLGV